jgi:hypothetical protein
MELEDKFIRNLNLTQQYCEKDSSISTPAESLRKFNPVINGSHIVEYKIEPWPHYGNLTLANWLIDPLEYEHTLDGLLELLIEQKENLYKTNYTTSFKGKILVTDYLNTITDGASENESNGFIDVYDLSPLLTLGSIFMNPII